jgi:hypothetical protein
MAATASAAPGGIRGGRPANYVGVDQPILTTRSQRGF